jgi:hypothetical protein
MLPVIQRVFQAVVFVTAGFMVLGGGFSYRDTLAEGYVRTLTYTLYKTLPPPPKGPRYCPIAAVGGYDLVLPCNFVPPFIWWLEHRAG